MPALRRLAFAAGLLAVACVCSAAEAANDPVPAAEDLEKAQTTIRDLFKAEFAKTKQADRLALSAKLYSQSLEEKDPATRFALLREARDLAAKGGDAPGVLRITDEMTFRFAMKPAEALGPALEPLAASTNSNLNARMIAEMLLVAADEARFSGDWPLNAAIMKAAFTAAGKTTGLATTEKVRAKSKDSEAGRIEFEKSKEAFETLKQKPADAAACTAAGRFLTFFQQEWTEGINYLSRGSDEKLQALAQRDQKAMNGMEDEKLAAGDAWFDFAASSEGTLKSGAQIRAHHWYAAVYPTLSGVNKTKVEKRIADLQAVVDAKADRTDMWRALRRGVGEDRTKRSRALGTAIGDKTFEESPGAGGYLIGYHYTLGANKLPNVIQPIYMTPFGEQTGANYGVPGKKDTARATIKAKPGYAVGSLVIGGGRIDTLKPVFMRISGAGLNKNDAYDGPQIGAMSDNTMTIGGGGTFIVGLHGKVAEKTGKIEALGVISLVDESVPKKKKK